jgi:hypothetical protein
MIIWNMEIYSVSWYRKCHYDKLMTWYYVYCNYAVYKKSYHFEIPNFLNFLFFSLFYSRMVLGHIVFTPFLQRVMGDIFLIANYH